MVAAVIILFAMRMDYAANGRGEAFHLEMFFPWLAE